MPIRILHVSCKCEISLFDLKLDVRLLLHPNGTQAVMCLDKSCTPLTTKQVDRVYCVPSSFALSMRYVGEMQLSSKPSKVMMITFFISLFILFLMSMLIFFCVGSPERMI